MKNLTEGRTEDYEKNKFKNIVEETYLDFAFANFFMMGTQDLEYVNIITSVKSSLENNETISFADVTNLLRCVNLRLKKPLMTKKEMIKFSVLHNCKGNLKFLMTNQKSLQREQKFMESYLLKELKELKG